MSGICAVWGCENPGKMASTLASMTGALSLTGSERVEVSRARRTGVGVSAAFPMQELYSDEQILVACDADLCNHEELRCWSTRDANTAALMADLYRRFGCEFVNRLTGSFSVIVLDLRQHRLMAAVDRFGIHRLVYCENGPEFSIASRIDALVRAGCAPPQVNPRAIANVLNFGVNLAPDTIFRGVTRLAPGMSLVVSENGVSVRKYWDMRYGVNSGSSEESLSRRLEAVVEHAVAAECRAEAFPQIGAYLSGGTDSSTVVGMMSRTGRGPVRAFSIGFEEERFNELAYAEIAARKFAAEHYTYLVSPRDCFEALPDMVRAFDEPFGNSSAVPTYYCARLAAQNGVKVLLAGDGGDELFGGNERYRTDKIFELYQAVPAAIRKRLIEPVLKGLPYDGGAVGLARRYVRRSNLPRVERYLSYNFLCAHAPDEVFNADFMAELAGDSLLEVPARYYHGAPARDHLDRLLYLDVKITLGDSDLPKVTQMSELAGVRTRFPFLHPDVAELSGAIPAHWKVKRLEKRYLFKRAFRNLLPAEILKKTKHGFGIPVARWLKSDPRLSEFSRDTLFSARALDRGYFRREFLEELVRKHEADESTYYGDTLWTFLVLELWHKQYVDQPVGAAV